MIFNTVGLLLSITVVLIKHEKCTHWCQVLKYSFPCHLIFFSITIFFSPFGALQPCEVCAQHVCGKKQTPFWCLLTRKQLKDLFSLNWGHHTQTHTYFFFFFLSRLFFGSGGSKCMSTCWLHTLFANPGDDFYWFYSELMMFYMTLILTQPFCIYTLYIRSFSCFPHGCSSGWILCYWFKLLLSFRGHFWTIVF